MRVEHGVCQVRVVPLGVGHRSSQPPVVGLKGDLQDPTRHRDGDPVDSEFTDERVHHFPGRFACDRYAAARRNTSFSCSSSRNRFRSSRFSPSSSDAGPDRSPSSRSARLNQLFKHDSEIPIRHDVLHPDARLTTTGDADHVLTELSGIRPRHGAHPSSSAHSTTDQMSPSRAAVPPLPEKPPRYPAPPTRGLRSPMRR